MGDEPERAHREMMVDVPMYRALWESIDRGFTKVAESLLTRDDRMAEALSELKDELSELDRRLERTNNNLDRLNADIAGPGSQRLDTRLTLMAMQIEEAKKDAADANQKVKTAERWALGTLFSWLCALVYLLISHFWPSGTPAKP